MTTSRQTLSRRERFLNACRRLPVDRVPVWFMRQAGRYLPGYQQWRGRLSFRELLRQPEAAADITLEPLAVLDVDALILFSDILVLPEAMGMELHFDDDGPRFAAPIEDRRDIERLQLQDGELGYVEEAIQQVVSRAGPEVPLIGFAGGPLTLALFMIEGGVGRQFERSRRFASERPQDFARLLQRLGETLIPFLIAQAKAGAAALQLFDSYAGLFSPQDYRRLALPVVQEIVAEVGKHADLPIIYYANDSHPLIEAMAETGADVLGLDWRTDLQVARVRVERPLTLQGNLDPACLFGDEERLQTQARAVLESGGRTGHIFNVGHGLLPGTPVERVQQLVKFVQDS